MNALDPDSLRFQREVDDLVRRWADGDSFEYWRRWKQLGSWSINKTQGDVVKKAALKKRLMEMTGGRCEDCRDVFTAGALQMHRLDTSFAHDKERNFGYVEGNIALLCAPCHQRRESDLR